MKVNERHKMNEWLNGPKFLLESENSWPNPPEGLKGMPDEHLEWRKMAHVNEISMSSQSDELAKYLEYYSSWYSIQKGVAWLRRFLHSTKSKSANKESKDSLKGHLTVKELRSTTESIVKYVQHQCFPDEIERLETIPNPNCKTKDGKVKNRLKGSNLRKLNPILVNGIPRIGGRLERSSLPFDAKHSITLPRSHHITKLIIRHYHHCEGHMDARQVLAVIRTSFWIKT